MIDIPSFYILGKQQPRVMCLTTKTIQKDGQREAEIFDAKDDLI